LDNLDMPMKRYLPGLAALLLLAAVPGRGALAQPAQKAAPPAAAGTAPGAGPKAGPSPVAPGDLSKPVFDTSTPVYGTLLDGSKAASTIVAEVEGRAITLGDVGDVIKGLPPQVGRLPFETLFPNVLDQLVRQAALVVRAQQQGMDEDPVVRRHVKAAADKALASEFLDREISKGITESALLERYNRDVAGRPGAEEVRARVISVYSEKEARDLIAEIRGGADFAAVARRASKDQSAPNGGDVGFNMRDDLAPEVSAVAFALPVGEMTAYPVRAANAWFIVKVEERRQLPTPSFAMVREALTRIMLREAVVPEADAALASLKVREYSVTGKETDKPEGQ